MHPSVVSAIQTLVMDCENHGHPIRGLFALAQLVAAKLGNDDFLKAAKRLCELDVDGDRFKPFAIVTINAWLKEHPFCQDRWAWQNLKLDTRGETLIDRPGRAKKVSIATSPSAWTLVGLASEHGLSCLFDLAMVGAPGLSAGGPALGESIPRRTAKEPVGCWVPAFMDGDQMHDLIDGAVTRFNPKGVSRVLAVLEAQKTDPDLLGRYLAHQAAHTVDAFDDTMKILEEALKDEDLPMSSRPNFNPASHIVGHLINAGARMTQRQWGGPINPMLKGDRRTFGKGEDRVLELVHTVVGNDFDDEVKARTLKRMASEGHDIVIAHRDRNPSRDRYESTTMLPLHACASQGHTKSMGVLLDHGADPRALVLHMGMLKTVEMIAEGVGHPESVDVLRSHAARGRAHSILDDIASNAFRTRTLTPA